MSLFAASRKAHALRRSSVSLPHPELFVKGFLQKISTFFRQTFRSPRGVFVFYHASHTLSRGFSNFLRHFCKKIRVRQEFQACAGGMHAYVRRERETLHYIIGVPARRPCTVCRTDVCPSEGVDFPRNCAYCINSTWKILLI